MIIPEKVIHPLLLVSESKKRAAIWRIKLMRRKRKIEARRVEEDEEDNEIHILFLCLLSTRAVQKPSFHLSTMTEVSKRSAQWRPLWFLFSEIQKSFRITKILVP
jgi:hypothetical protein